MYVPQKSTINPQDIAFFLSTRLVTAASGENQEDQNNQTGVPIGTGDDQNKKCSNLFGGEDPVKRLRSYETKTAGLAAAFEEGVIRF